jgi:hypothetical protein
VRFDSRIIQARAVLAKHVSPSAIFYFLSQQTLEKVQLTKFDYDLGDGGAATVSVDGITDSFSTVALQSDQLGASKVLKDIIFSDIEVQTDGKISFHVTAKVDPTLLLYSKNVGSTPILPAEVPAASAATTTAATSTAATSSTQ